MAPTQIFRKGLNPRTVQQYWGNLGVHEQGEKEEVVAWIHEIDRRVQAEFAKVHPDLLLRNPKAQNLLKKQMGDALGGLPVLASQWPREEAVSRLYDLYRALRCAFPVEWGLSAKKPRASQAARARAAAPAAPTLSATAQTTTTAHPEVTQNPAPATEGPRFSARFVLQLLQSHDRDIRELRDNIVALRGQVAQLQALALCPTPIGSPAPENPYEMGGWQ
ncbi:uncharacterized protein N7515_000364 [Penicillium bovifimosum]|uniref:Uncharacterized protein n=1 Tax=Penicillium bovifimosum TaxID=126998 RepID=A0A9W9HH63_9EURO|nr:uncharacterized protein N7515_000364 [Penicillium bovifimosum]KAJ5145800.1 hypothetical protein N7515_000364 [Penicillium bovifimosum]